MFRKEKGCSSIFAGQVLKTDNCNWISAKVRDVGDKREREDGQWLVVPET